MPEIKIDVSTLPQDGQRVKWIKVGDEVYPKWKEGEYEAEEQLFVETDPMSDKDFDTAWRVLQWEPIDN
ncbi:MAG: hypothetical protein ACO1OQ_12850 [Rufibacter sp.]